MHKACPDDVGNWPCLISDDARYITGSIIAADSKYRCHNRINDRLVEN
jgi:hypothetical protein